MAHFAVILLTLLPPLTCGAVLVQTVSLLRPEIEWKDLVQGCPWCITAESLDRIALPQVWDALEYEENHFWGMAMV